MPKIDELAAYIAFDFGLKRIGAAVGQGITGSANTLETLKAENGTPDWDKIAVLIKQWQPAAFVIGIPLNMDGSEQTITQLARKFALELQTLFKLPVYEVDERLTTKSARQEIFKVGGFKELQKSQVDSYAAKLMLESWLRLHGF